MKKGNFYPATLTCKGCLKDIITAGGCWYVLIKREPNKADIKGYYHIDCYSNRKCENCTEFQEYSISGGRCNLLGINIAHSNILSCGKHKRIRVD